MKKALLLALLCISIKICSFNFSPIIPQNYFFSSEITAQSDVDLWYRPFFEQEMTPGMTGSGVVIAILDTNVSVRKTDSDISVKQLLSLNKYCKNQTKTAHNQELSPASKLQGRAKKDFAEAMKKNEFVRKLISKNHGAISIDLMCQVAPNIIILSIPILDDAGHASKQALYEGLLQARKHKVDILHLGFLVQDFDPRQKLDRKIARLVKKFKYVIAPVGNGGKAACSIGFPASLPSVISVASFGQQGNKFHLSDFCQTDQKCKAAVALPGEKIWTSVWIDELQENILLCVNGTSFSAAFMTGLLALLIEKNKNPSFSGDQAS